MVKLAATAGFEPAAIAHVGSNPTSSSMQRSPKDRMPREHAAEQLSGSNYGFYSLMVKATDCDSVYLCSTQSRTPKIKSSKCIAAYLVSLRLPPVRLAGGLVGRGWIPLGHIYGKGRI